MINADQLEWLEAGWNVGVSASKTAGVFVEGWREGCKEMVLAKNKAATLDVGTAAHSARA